MRQILRKNLLDRSQLDSFCFSIICDECGREWKSTTRSFSKKRIPPRTMEKQIIFNSLYCREHDMAQERAVDEAGHHFNVCPLCKHLVCDQCFMICDDLDMCTRCARQLHEQGQTVVM